MKKRQREFAGRRFLAALAILAITVFSIGAHAAQQKNKKDAAENATQLPPGMSAPASEQIDHDIGEMLGAFQAGNAEAMHKYYADNATFVSGGFEPPVVGWPNYVKQYESQRAAFPGMQVVRRNTFIFVHQDVSWATYQWQFFSTFNGKPFAAKGQTTLVFNKVGDNWVIVHNHTSESAPDEPSSPVQTGQNTPLPALAKP